MTTNNNIGDSVPFEPRECEFEDPDDPSFDPVDKEIENGGQSYFEMKIDDTASYYGGVFFNFYASGTTLLRGSWYGASPEFMELVEQSSDEGRITWDEYVNILDPAMVLRGKRKSDGATVYFLAEVRVNAGEGAVERVLGRARILSKVTGQTSLPGVICVSISRHQQQLAKELGVTLMRPPINFRHE